MSVRVFSVGLELPGGVAEYVPFRSDRSLFDADVIVFRPGFAGYYSHETYAGHSLISEDDSPAFVSDIAHWRSEFKVALESGKVVFVFLSRPETRYYYTGGRTHSGTGRSRVTTRHVEAKSSYDALPFALPDVTPRGGTEITVMSPLGALSGYWAQFAAISRYEVHFAGERLTALLGTKNRERLVGALLRTMTGGALVLLPPVTWDENALTYARGANVYWRKAGVELGHRLIQSLISASNALRRDATRTPVPDWIQQSTFQLPAAAAIEAEISALDRRQAALAQDRVRLEHRLAEERELLGLLYETGRPLENAILRALTLMGFNASGVNDGGSEFDAVFTAPEGRCLGEAEGKDSKAVNIDKMSQLERNLQEDFARDEIAEYAKGVLFGNAQRLLPVEERSAFFTAKCVAAAKRLRVALVRTPDLFAPARYLAGHSDEEYAAGCRNALFATEGGEVLFPPVPTA